MIDGTQCPKTVMLTGEIEEMQNIEGHMDGRKDITPINNHAAVSTTGRK